MCEISEQQIAVGDWVVAGKDGTDGLDIGQIVALDGDMAEIAWESLQRTTVDLTDDDVAVYATKEAAKRAYDERSKVAASEDLA